MEISRIALILVFALLTHGCKSPAKVTPPKFIHKKGPLSTDISGSYRWVGKLRKDGTFFGPSSRSYSASTFTIQRRADGGFRGTINASDNTIIRGKKRSRVIESVLTSTTTSSQELLFSFKLSKHYEREYLGPSTYLTNWLENDLRPIESKTADEINQDATASVLYVKVDERGDLLTKIAEKSAYDKYQRFSKPRSKKQALFKGVVFTINEATESIMIIGSQLTKLVRPAMQITVFNQGRAVATGRVARVYPTGALVQATKGFAEVELRAEVVIYK